jgi:hypothetical protein
MILVAALKAPGVLGAVHMGQAVGHRERAVAHTERVAARMELSVGKEVGRGAENGANHIR